jgi:hypothetical protein
VGGNIRLRRDAARNISVSTEPDNAADGKLLTIASGSAFNNSGGGNIRYGGNLVLQAGTGHLINNTSGPDAAGGDIIIRSGSNHLTVTGGDDADGGDIIFEAGRATGNYAEVGRISQSGALRLNQLGGSGTRLLRTDNSGNVSISTIDPANVGTVTSVGLTMPTGFSVASSPITTNGTIAVTSTLGPVKGNGSGFTASAINLSSEVTNVLPIANGGTNATSSPTNGGISYGTGSAYAFTAVGTSGQVLRSNGATAPTWVNAGTLLTAGTGITIATNTITNAGVTSLTGTANRISVSSATGAITISAPQDLHTGANITFNTVTATNDFFGRLGVIDTRATNAAPNTYDNEFAVEFKQRTTVGVPGSGTYSGMITLAPWGDNSGDLHHQLNFNNGGLYWRTGQPDESNAANWGAWSRLATERAMRHITYHAFGVPNYRNGTNFSQWFPGLGAEGADDSADNLNRQQTMIAPYSGRLVKVIVVADGTSSNGGDELSNVTIGFSVNQTDYSNPTPSFVGGTLYSINEGWFLHIYCTKQLDLHRGKQT